MTRPPRHPADNIYAVVSRCASTQGVMVVDVNNDEVTDLLLAQYDARAAEPQRRDVPRGAYAGGK